MGKTIPNAKELSAKKCQPCTGGVRPFAKDVAEAYLRQVPGWSLSSDVTIISRDYVMKDFLAAVDFVALIAEIAESQDHHPDFHLTGYRKLRIELATHSIGGLSENDFILAAKIDELPKSVKAQV
jgi:4a-hydroxytetrahydrobiopterin dehydratase